MEFIPFSNKFQRALLVVRNATGSDFPAQQLMILLDVASNPDTPIGEIGKRLDMPTSSVSRSVAALSNWSWTKKSGYGLVEKTEDIYEARRKLVRLTQHGKQLVKLMKDAFHDEQNVASNNISETL